MFDFYQNTQHFMLLSVNLFSSLSIQEQVKYLENVKLCIEDIKELYQKKEFEIVNIYAEKIIDLLKDKKSNHPEVQQIIDKLINLLQDLKSVQNE